MKKSYVVFWLDQQREIYGDDYFYVLGQWMSKFDTEDEALVYIKGLNLKANEICTVIPIYCGN